jgi:glycosyltransferase involved in cell wall biosynthesis
MDKTPVSILTNLKSMCPTFSIIIAHYDIPDLLMRCLKSIPVLEDIQVIVVDDNSPDADTYLERYPELSRPYLEFIRAPKNGGAGYARNIGLDHAKGKWQLFADADDFFMDNMHDIISTHAESDADVIYFRKQAVYSDDINRKSTRSGYLDRIMDIYLKTGDELPVRTRHHVPWGKMIKKSLIENHRIRFEEIKYSNDILFSVHVGCFANKIEAIDTVLYVVTSREGSLHSGSCTKTDELKIRAGAAFRYDSFLFQHNMCQIRQTAIYLKRMLSQDRNLYKYYFTRLDGIYPSKIAALKDISKGCSRRFKIKLYLYSFLIWISRYSVS